MKKIYIILSILIINYSVYSQNVEFIYQGSSIGDEYKVDTNNANIEYINFTMFVKNNEMAQQNITFERTRIHHRIGWADQICDHMLCFDLDDEDYWERPSSFNIDGESSILFKLQIIPNNLHGCAIYNYKIKNNLGDVLDEIEVTFTTDGRNCFLSVDQPEKKVSYSVYPNPATNLLTVDVSNIESNTVLKIYDIVGKEVKSIELINGKNQMDVSNLNSGIYFYTIFKDNKSIIETKKLVIK